jgi:hypothetical protein
MATISLGFNLSASAVQMASGINAGVVELEKLGLAAKKTQRDVSTLKTIEIGRAFIGGIQAITSSISQANTLLSGFVTESVSIGEEASKANVVFGESAKAVAEFANSASGIGLSSRAALQATASFGNLFTAIGLSQRQAAEFSVDLVKLAADLASFNNTTIEDATLAIGAALRGEAEPIRRYGVLLNDAQLKQVAYANSLAQVGEDLTPAVKAQAAYFAILKQTGTAQGDFARTSDGLANQQRILAAEWDNVRATIGEGLQPAYKAFVSGLRESLPAIQAAGQQLSTFIGQIDFTALIRSVVSSVQSLAESFGTLVSSAAPLAGNILPLIGGYLAFINRQVVASAVSNLSGTFIAAAASAYRFAGAAGVAAVGVRTLAASIRGLLASTGLGILVTVLGLLAGQVVEWSLATNTAGQEVATAIDSPTKAAAGYRAAIAAATKETQDFGKKAKDALKVPTFTAQDLAQEAIDEASAAVKALAKELGGLNRVPSAVLERFREIKGFAEGITTDSLAFGDAIRLAGRDAQALTTEVRNITDARKADAEAAKAAADAAKKAADEARQRTAELANAGLGDAEKSRLQLNKDLLAIVTEQRAAEEALAAAKRAGDSKSLADARQRLALSQAAAKEAKAQDRERQLQALGVDKNILKPATTLADQFKSVRQAFDKKLIDGGEAQTALRNLAKEGIDIRKEISRELSRPAASALNVNDIRTSEGISAVFALGREDPAIAQRRDQLKKLEEIKQGLLAIGASPVEILGS